MSREISLFNDYSIKENILSNHCGVILKLLYEIDPKGFEEVISNLAECDFQISPSFEQQTRKNKSIPDITIEQKSFSIFFETKRFDWFYDKQIKNHISGFKTNNDYNILFLLSNFEEEDYKEKFADKIAQAKEELGVILTPISFEELLQNLENLETDEEFERYLEEFREYLDRNGYLPSWKYFLNIVNCASTINEVHFHNVYMCPNTGGKYKHQRFKYFGGYKSKNIKFIHELKALVVVEKNLENPTVKWNNFNETESELIEEALLKFKNLPYREEENKERELQVFLLQNPAEVNFRKSSPGGLYSSKKYMKNIAREMNSKDSQELAKALEGRTWE